MSRINPDAHLWQSWSHRKTAEAGGKSRQIQMKPDTQITVLQSFGPPETTSNPYVFLLCSALPSQVQVEFFSWRKAFVSRYHVFHVHWPEQLFRGSGGLLKRFARVFCFMLLLVRLAASRCVVVQTVHNLIPHENLNLYERLLLRALDQITIAWIHHNALTPREGKAVVADIPHGDYRVWFRGLTVPDVVSGRVLFFGLVRPYKGVEQLVAAFADTPNSFTLHVAGRPMNEAYAHDLRGFAQGRPRVELHLEHLSDGELAVEIGEAQLVVLPYKQMHNSGALLLALSLNRPVLVPDNPTNRGLREEFGAQWIHLFPHPLTGLELRSAMEAVSTIDPTSHPDLSLRDWGMIGIRTYEVYAAAIRRNP